MTTVVGDYFFQGDAALYHAPGAGVSCTSTHTAATLAVVLRKLVLLLYE